METCPSSVIPFFLFVRFLRFVVKNPDPCSIRVSSVAQESHVFTSLQTWARSVAHRPSACLLRIAALAPKLGSCNTMSTAAAGVRGATFAGVATRIVTLFLLRLATNSPPGWPSWLPSMGRPVLLDVALEHAPHFRVLRPGLSPPILGGKVEDLGNPLPGKIPVSRFAGRATCSSRATAAQGSNRAQPRN